MIIRIPGFHIFNACLFLALAIVITGCVDSDPVTCTDTLGCIDIPPDKPVEIGILQVLSGGLRAQGQMQVRGVEICLAKRGNRLLGHPVQLHIADSGCSGEAGINAALSFTTNPKIVGIIGTYCSSAATAAVEFVSKAGMVMISGTNSAPSLTSINGKPGDNWYPGYFRTMYNGIIMAEMAADFAFKALDVKKAATINDGDNFTLELTKEFERNYTELGGEIVKSIGINKGDKDMKPALEALAYSKPGLIYFPLFEPEAVCVIEQARDIAGLENIILIGSGGANSETFLNSVGDSGMGFYLTATDSISSKQKDKLYLDYESKYGEKPIHFSLPYVYDAASLLFAAIESAAIKKADGTLHIGRAALRKALYGTDGYQGISGRLTCDKFGDLFGGSYSIIRFDVLPAGPEPKRYTSRIVYRY